MNTKLKSRPADPEETRRRVEAALRKHELGEPLDQTEELIVYWVRNGGGCHACGSPAGGVVPGGPPGISVDVRNPDRR